MEVKYVSPAELIPYAKNAKQHPPEQVERIANSIKRFGWQQPIVVDRDNVVIIGHGRLFAAKELMLDSVPVVYADNLTEDEVNALRLADNKTNESAWDFSALEEELAALDIAGIDMTQFGFDDLSAIGGATSEITEDEPPEPKKEPKSKRGEIYRLGNHFVMCGDSTNPEDVEKLMNGEKADIAFTSPPYGAGGTAKLREHYERGKETIDSFYNEHDDNIGEWLQLIEKSFANMQTHTEAQFINVQMLADNKIDLLTFMNENKDNFVDLMIWDKLTAPPQMQNNVLNNRFEFILIYSNDNCSRTIPFGDFHGNKNNIFQLTHGQNEYAEIHKAVFPVELPAMIINTASKCRSVLDLFGGTGTTLIACEQTGRKCYMMELDPLYVDVIIERWENMTKQKAELIQGDG